MKMFIMSLDFLEDGIFYWYGKIGRRKMEKLAVDCKP
jgi:hypothetical protein